MLDFLHQVLEVCVEYGVFLLELVGVLIVIVTAIRSLIGLFKKDKRVRLEFNQGLELALGFLLGGEVLHTVVAQDWSTLLTLGGVIVLRSAITFLIHWENKSEKEHQD